jgi:hypothetical protein
MNAYATADKPARQRGDTTLVVIPSALVYTDQMAASHQAAYGYTPAEVSPEDLTAEKFARHLQFFPEGQFMALEVETDRIVGAAVSMRMDFDPRKPDLRSWSQITTYG